MSDDDLSPAQRYAAGVRAFVVTQRTLRTRAFLQSLRDLDRGHSADRFADPELGLTHFERHQLRTRRPFGARGR